MSKVVDERVVEMRFDNKNFESNVKTTMSSLDKLKSKLNFSGASKGFSEMGNSVKQVSFDALGRSVDAVQAKFSALQVVGMTALANITNSAINTGKRIISALTIDPIKTGFQEYETQINSVQTILANTQHQGTNLDQVNAALDTLNTYADKTIYNFTEMTRNIGTFTAAGVDLDTSVSAIQGIANLAAVSGSTSQQASTAMYQLSQALAAGRATLMDWNSVVNAGMGGKVFQEALKDTARAQGIAIDEIIANAGSFRDSLQEEWMTTEVLTETLSKMTKTGAAEYLSKLTGVSYSQIEAAQQLASETGNSSQAYDELVKTMAATGAISEEEALNILKLADTAEEAATEVKTFTQLWDTLKEAAQSGWTQSWELIIGDFGEAKDLLTDISDAVSGVINSTSESRNKLLSEGLSSGWKQMLSQGISDTEGFKDTVISVAKDHGVAIDDMIDKTGSFEKSLKEGWMTSDILAESIDKTTQEITGLSEEEQRARGYTAEQVAELEKLNQGIKDGSVNLDEYVTKMSRMSGRENVIEGLRNIVSSLVDIGSAIGSAFREIFPAMTGEQLYSITENFKNFTEKLKLSKDALENLKNTFKGVFSILSIVKQAFMAVYKVVETVITSLAGGATSLGGAFLSITGFIGKFLSKLNDAIGNLNILEGVLGVLRTVFTSIGDAITSVVDNIGSSVGSKLTAGLSSMGSSVVSIFGTILSGIGGALSNLFGYLSQADIGALLQNVISIIADGTIIAAMTTLKETAEKAGGVLKGLGNVTGVLKEVRETLETYQDKLKADTLKSIALAIAILAGSLYLLASIKPEDMQNALNGITALFLELSLMMVLFSRINPKRMISAQMTVMQLVGIAVAIGILAVAMRILGTMNWDQYMVAMTAFIGIVGVLLVAARMMSGEDMAIAKFAGQMLVMSVAIGILAVVAKLLGTMEWEELGKAGAGILGAVVIFATAAALMNGVKLEGFAAKMLVLSVAIGILAVVAKQLGSMSWEELGKAGSGILGAIVIFATAAMLMQGVKIEGFAAKLIVLSVALGALTAVGKQLASMSWEELGKAGAGLLGIVVILATAIAILNANAGEATMCSLQLLAMAAAVSMVATVLETIGKMGDDQLLKGIIGLGAALTILSISLKSMSGSLTGAASLVAASLAIMVLAQALSVINAIGIEGIVVSIVAAAIAFGVLGAAGYFLMPFIPILLQLAGVIALIGVGCLAAGLGLTMFAAAIGTLIGILAGGAYAATEILKMIPQAMKSFAEGMIAFLETLAANASKVGDALVTLFIGALDALVNALPTIVAALANIFITILNGLAEYLPQMVEALVNFLVQLLNSIASYSGELITAGVEVIAAIFKGIFDNLGSIVQEILVPILDVFKETLVGIFEALAPYLPLICESIEDMVETISEAMVLIAAIMAPAMPYIAEIVQAISDAVDSICDAFNTVVESIPPVIDSITWLIQQLGESICDILNTLSDVFKETCDSIIDVVESLGGIIDSVFGGISDVIETTGEAIRNVLDGISGIFDSMGDAVLNAGRGFDKLADGVERIVNLNIADLGGSMGAVALGLKDISKHSEGVGEAATSLHALATGFDRVGSSIDGLASDIRDVVDSINSIESISSFSMGSVSTAIESASTSFQILSTAAWTAAANLRDAFASMIAASASFGASGNAMMVAFASAIISNISIVTTALQTMIASSLAILTGSVASFMVAGLLLATTISLGITAGAVLAVTAVGVMVASAAAAASSANDSFFIAGSNAALGFAQGIASSSFAAVIAATAMANAAVTAAKSALDINSPSKVFRKIGTSVPEGFAQGIDKLGYMVKDSSESMAETAIEGTKSAVSRIADIVNSDIDAQPTIRPVVDLSDVESGAMAINDLLGNDTITGVTANVGSINTMMNRRNQNGTNDDVVTAVNKLRGDIGKMEKPTYVIEGITYDDGSNISDAVQTLVRAARVERRV